MDAVQQAKPSQKVLEVGCGTGYGSFFLSKYFGEIKSIDIDPDAINYAKENYEASNLTYLHVDLLTDKEYVNKNLKSFDVIICFEVIEHLDRQKALELMSILKKMKKDGGIAYISTPNYLPHEERTKNRQEVHIHEYTYQELKEDLEKVFTASIILSQIDEAIGSFNPKKAWNYFSINF